ncbi:hypothetical protein J437_LFUL002722 [Ladona fulva]|uniref:Uncharacterized protein n=1 Tax=Ladona fulva TaxID=123851 RepID=A0A8K0K1J3_LADFU|nr:hypothetical protein J437_LFUL002722 [Ladona fulva]
MAIVNPANALWNNMLEPVGEKSNYWGPEFKTVKCPTKEMPYIYTMKNSEEFLDRVRKNDSSLS